MPEDFVHNCKPQPNAYRFTYPIGVKIRSPVLEQYIFSNAHGKIEPDISRKKRKLPPDPLHRQCDSEQTVNSQAGDPQVANERCEHHLGLNQGYVSVSHETTIF